MTDMETKRGKLMAYSSKTKGAKVNIEDSEDWYDVKENAQQYVEKLFKEQGKGADATFGFAEEEDGAKIVYVKPSSTEPTKKAPKTSDTDKSSQMKEMNKLNNQTNARMSALNNAVALVTSANQDQDKDVATYTKEVQALRKSFLNWINGQDDIADVGE